MGRGESITLNPDRHAFFASKGFYSFIIILFKEKNKYILIQEFIINYHASLNRLDASILVQKVNYICW